MKRVNLGVYMVIPFSPHMYIGTKQNFKVQKISFSRHNPRVAAAMDEDSLQHRKNLGKITLMNYTVHVSSFVR